MEPTSAPIITIGRERYELIDEIDTIPLVDSFVKHNKLASSSGSGEARLYVGAQGRIDFAAFFNNFEDKGFFLKSDFKTYLNDAAYEYLHQEQKYRRDIAASWQGYINELAGFNEKEYFSFHPVSDNARYYIRSHDHIFYEYFRRIMLPLISYISIQKLRSGNGEQQFLFRPSLSYSFNPYYHPAKERQEEAELEKKVEAHILKPTEKKQLVAARIGQGEYRDRLIKESSECVVTRVNDERLLIASHIKPWNVSDDKERLDHNNGLLLTPTYDKLFDQGFITFLDDGSLIASPYISPMNMKKLSVSSGRKYRLPPSDKRLAYLAYHREHIFKP